MLIPYMPLRFTFIPLLLAVVSLGTILPLFRTEFFPMHDDTQPSRIQQMTKALQAGQFPVRWVPDLGYGYGYPIFNFYAPLPYYVGSLFYLSGAGAILSAKIMMAIGLIAAGITMFLLGRTLFGALGGIVAAALYLYAPYHAIQFYVRGAVGEFYAYAFLPLIVLGISEAVKGRYRRGFIVGSLATAAVLCSHTVSGMLLGYFFGAGIFVAAVWGMLTGGILKGNYLSALWYTILFFILGIGLSAFFTFPAFVEKDYTRVEELTSGGSDFHAHFVYPDQLWDSPWGYAGSAAGRADGMSFKVGKTHILLGLFGLLAMIASYYKILFFRRLFPRTVPRYIFFIIVGLLISLSFILPISERLWEMLPGFAYIQYPWRFLTFPIFSLALSTAYLFSKPYKFQAAAALATVALIVVVNIKYFTHERYILKQDSDYTSTEALRFPVSKISDEYLPKGFPVPQLPAESAQSFITKTADIAFIEVQKDAPTEKRVRIQAFQPTRLSFAVARFPGWKVFRDGTEQPDNPSEPLLGVSLPVGESDVRVVFRNTPVRTWANSISLFSGFLLVYVGLGKRKKRHG